MILRTERLSLTRGSKILCNGAHFSIKPGEIWGILGPNGCGKTTLLHSLAGLYPKTNGHIFLNSQPLNSYSAKQLAQHIGVLLQEQEPVFSQTVFEFCAGSRFPHLSHFKRLKMEDHAIITESLVQMDLMQFKNQNIQTLSGGEKKRVQIAALLAQTPHIYLLDEPTNHLDLHRQQTTLKHFSALAKRQSKSIIIALHDINLAQLFCDFIIMLQEGKCLIGPTDRMLTPQNLSQLYHCSFQKLENKHMTVWQVST